MAPVVIVGALVQSLLVVGDPTPEGAWGFALRVVMSGLALIGALWLIVGAAATAVKVDARFSMPSIRLLTGVTAAVVIGALTGVLSPILPIVVAAVALPLLSALAVEPRTTAFRTVTYSPGRALLGYLWIAVLSIVNWVIALMLGFFVAGPVAAALTWVVFGFSTAVLATYWAAMHLRAQEQKQAGPKAHRSGRTVGSE
ncbi:MAG: hypothetical protein ACK4UY_01485 [Dietzia sp.]